MSERPRSRRFSRQDWLELGLSALATAGPAALTIEALCHRAQKTRGSFYSHFDSSESFLLSLAGTWRDTYTLELMGLAEERQETIAKLGLLNELAVRLDPKVEQGMRSLAAVDAGVSDICNQVDAERVNFLEKLYRETGLFAETWQSHVIAKIEYAAFVGMQQIDPGASPAYLQRLYMDFMKLTGRA
ncbi:MAG: TetR/AcrR family transcriptional regulator [Bosea sp. (in: a-proteobacteria)]